MVVILSQRQLQYLANSEDERLTRRLSHENPEIKEIYDNFLVEPLGEISEELLHTEYFDKSNLLNGKV